MVITIIGEKIPSVTAKNVLLYMYEELPFNMFQPKWAIIS